MDNIVQGSEEWFAARLGKLTASRIADACSKTRSGAASAGHINLVAQLVAERLTGKAADSFTSGPMQWGIDTEPAAREAYEFLRDISVEQVGFVDHPEIEMCGASPDGLVGDDGLIEIKCPNTATHIATLKSPILKPAACPVPNKYLTQMQWQMACTNRKWCDFVSFDPRLPPRMQIFIYRVERDDEAIADMADRAVEFLAEVNNTVKILEKQYG